jgi:hypothetical protein
MSGIGMIRYRTDMSDADASYAYSTFRVATVHKKPYVCVINGALAVNGYLI